MSQYDTASDESLIEALKTTLSNTTLSDEQQNLFTELARRAGNYQKLNDTIQQQQNTLAQQTSQLKSVNKAYSKIQQDMQTQSQMQQQLQKQMQQQQQQFQQFQAAASQPTQSSQQSTQPTTTTQPPHTTTTTPATQTTTSSALKPSKPSKYAGSVRELANWLFAMDSFFSAAGVSDEFEKTKFAVTLLDGRALAWWRSLVSGGFNNNHAVEWPMFVNALRVHFKDTDSEYHMRQRLANLKQTKSVDLYIEKFREIITDMGNTAPDVRTQYYDFLAGLKPAVRQQVLLGQPKDLMAAMLMSSRTDNVLYSLHKHDDKGPRPMELGKVQKYQGGNNNGKKQFHNTTKTFNKKIECWYCGKQGHIERNCLKCQKDGKSNAGSTPRYNKQNNWNKGKYNKGKQLYQATSDISNEQQQGYTTDTSSDSKN